MRLIRFAILLPLLVSSLAAQDKNWKQTLENHLKREFPPRTTGGLRGDIKNPGVVLSIQQSGVRAVCESAFVLPVTRVKDSRVANPATRTTSGQAILPIGTQVVVRDIAVSDKAVAFKLTTTGTFSVGGLDAGAALSGNRPLTGRECNFTVHYEFDEDTLATADLTLIKKVVHSLLATAADVATANQKTVELGQTLEQVEKILGKPATIAKLGNKTIYAYPNMKVIFIDGKVTDVQ